MYRPLADDAEVERRIVGAIRRTQWHVDAARVELALKNLDRVWRKAGFNPGQPRVPAGSPDGGQWIGTSGSGERPGIDDPRVLSDAAPYDGWKPGAQYASNRAPLGQFPGATPAQQARFAAVSARADSAIRQVRQVDPTWQPRVASLSAPNSIEGAIGHAEARALAAEAKLRELGSQPHSNLLEAYRANNATPDLFGTSRWDRARNTVAVATPGDRQIFFGINSGAPTYTSQDRDTVRSNLDSVIEQYPMIRPQQKAFYHAESTILFRMSEAFGGTLTGRSLRVTVDREICGACEQVLPRLGVYLGNPSVSFYDRLGFKGIVQDRDWFQLRPR
jgi:hypothetical protein